MCLVCLFFCSQDWVFFVFVFDGVFSAVRTSHVCFVCFSAVRTGCVWFLLIVLVWLNRPPDGAYVSAWLGTVLLVVVKAASFFVMHAVVSHPPTPPFFFFCVFVCLFFCSQDWLRLVSVDRAGLVKQTNWRCMRFNAG